AAHEPDGISAVERFCRRTGHDRAEGLTDLQSRASPADSRAIPSIVGITACRVVSSTDGVVDGPRHTKWVILGRAVDGILDGRSRSAIHAPGSEAVAAIGSWLPAAGVGGIGGVIG